jgi:hypothetical protein
VFESYSLTSKGVEVTFPDGTKEVGAILVSADGTRSRVRQQLMSGFTILDTEGRAIFSKTFSTPNDRASVSSEMLQGMCLAGQQNKSMPNLFSDVMQLS